MLSIATAMVLAACGTADGPPDGANGTAMFRGNPAHTGVYETAGILDSPEVLWTFETGGPVVSSPAIVGGRVFVGSDDGSLYAIDEATGERIWAFETGGPVRSSPAVAGGRVFFGSYDGTFRAVDAESGQLAWAFTTSGERRWRARGLDGIPPADEIHDDPWDFFLSSPVVVDDAVYFGTGEGLVYGLDAATGEVRWVFETLDTVHSSPALVDGVVYVGNMESRLYAIDATDGTEVWHYQAGTDSTTFNQHGLQSSPVIANGLVYIGGRDGGLHAVDISTGERAWKFDTNGSWVLGSAAVHEGRLYLGTSDTNMLRAVDATTGEEIFGTSLETFIYSSPALAGGVVYVGTGAGVLFALDALTGETRWRFRTEASQRDEAGVLNDDGTFNYPALFVGPYNLENTFAAVDRFLGLGAFLSSPVLQDGVLVVGSADGNVYALRGSPTGP